MKIIVFVLTPVMLMQYKLPTWVNGMIGKYWFIFGLIVCEKSTSAVLFRIFNLDPFVRQTHV